MRQEEIIRRVIQVKLLRHKKCYQTNDFANKHAGKAIFRHTNFPSEVSEHLVMWALNELKLYDAPVVWNKLLPDLPGDLSSGKKMLEVKAYNRGPTTYGPTEKWDEIWFLNTSNFIIDTYELHRIKLSNESHEWSNVVFGKKKEETYREKCDRGLRPRQCFADTLKQIDPQHVETYRFRYDSKNDNIFIL